MPTGYNKDGSKRGKFPKGNTPWTKGRKFSDEHKKKISEALMGEKNPNFKKSPSLETRKKISQNHTKGEKHHNWKGGVSPIYNTIRHSFEYKLWREAVFKRDNYTCVWCGNNKSGNLNADHIKPFSLFPELRFALDNGRTLCVPCHRTTDTYGARFLYNKKVL